MSIKKLLKKISGVKGTLLTKAAVKYYKMIKKQNRGNIEIKRCCDEILQAIEQDDEVTYNDKTTELADLMKLKYARL